MTTETKKTTAKKGASKSTKKDTTIAKTTENTETTTTKTSVGQHDLIPCMCVVRGELGIGATKSGNEYFFGDYGDIAEIEYQDLTFLRLKKSKFLYKPWIVVMDTSVLDAKRDADLIAMSDLYSRFESMETLFELPNNEIIEILVNAPSGFQEAAYYTAHRLLKTGALDSVGIINYINKILGVQLDTSLVV